MTIANLKSHDIYLSTKGTVFKIIGIRDNQLEVEVLAGNAKERGITSIDIVTFTKWFHRGAYTYLGRDIPKLAEILYG